MLVWRAAPLKRHKGADRHDWLRGIPNGISKTVVLWFGVVVFGPHQTTKEPGKQLTLPLPTVVLWFGMVSYGRAGRRFFCNGNITQHNSTTMDTTTIWATTTTFSRDLLQPECLTHRFHLH
jgi:hypothetical protein